MPVIFINDRKIRARLTATTPGKLANRRRTSGRYALPVSPLEFRGGGEIDKIRSFSSDDHPWVLDKKIEVLISKVPLLVFDGPACVGRGAR